MRILIVEDEKHLALPLAQLLREKNYEVENVFDGRDGLDYGISGDYDAIILDIMLPKMSGLDVLKNLRASGKQTPILMLTAKSEAMDIVAGLNMGADDYLTKPFSSDVLVARLCSITRRKGDTLTKEGALAYGNVRLDVETLILGCAGGKPVSISRKEAFVMECLMRGAPGTCEKQAIFTYAWGYDTDAQLSIVEVYISFLRKKLDYIGADCKIMNVRGIGYRLEASHV